jgi:hypothetical protein
MPGAPINLESFISTRCLGVGSRDNNFKEMAACNLQFLVDFFGFS